MNIAITNDEVVEQTESFYVTLERTAGLNNSVSLSPTRKMITIINDDGESCMSHLVYIHMKDEENRLTKLSVGYYPTSQ